LKAPSFEAHVPPTHAAVAGQTLPQVPQLLLSVVVLAQPLVQHVCPAEQAGPPLQSTGAVQTLATQVSPEAHALPHAPQLLGSLVVSLHPVEQHCSAPVQAGPPLQVVAHMPPLQTSPGAQETPHLPQLFGSVLTSVQPVVAQHSSVPVQAGPPLQVVEHMLFEQSLPGGQAMPQPPQFCESLVVFEQPVMQHCCVAAQAGPPLQVALVVHRPITHD
jgi:hypothetical protein